MVSKKPAPKKPAPKKPAPKPVKAKSAKAAKKPVAKKPTPKRAAAKKAAPKPVAKKAAPPPNVVQKPSIPPDFESAIDDDDGFTLRSVSGPRDYVLRTRDGDFLHDVSEFTVANQLARALGVRVKVFKRTPEGEVLLSYSGPGKWD